MQFPKNEIGLAQGVFGGAANEGAALAAILMPIAAERFGWRASFILSSIPLVILSTLFFIHAKETPTGDRKKIKKISISVLNSSQARLIGLANFAAFGTLLGFVAWLPFYFHEVHSFPITSAGILASLAYGIGMISRPLGGFIADRAGEKRTLIFPLSFLTVFYMALGLTPNFPIALLSAFCIGIFVGFASGYLQALPPLMFKKEVGTVFGLAGSFGVLGGVILPPVFGFLIILCRRLFHFSQRLLRLLHYFYFHQRKILYQ